MTQGAQQAQAAPAPAIDPNDPDVARVAAAYGLASQEGMTPELATQILALADSTPAQVQAAVDAVAAQSAQVRAAADARLAEERAIHDDITAKLDTVSQEEAADYATLRGEQDSLLAAARGLNEQVGRVVAFFGLPAPGGLAQAAPAGPPADEREGGLGRFFGLFVERKDDDERPAQRPEQAATGPVKGDEPPIYDAQDDDVRKVGILAALIALPNKSAEQVLTMVKPQGIDLAAIGRIVGEAHDIAARQIRQSDAIIALIETRHQEEVARLGAAANKENTQFAATVADHAAATAQADALDAQIAHLRQFFAFPTPGARRQGRGV